LHAVAHLMARTAQQNRVEPSVLSSPFLGRSTNIIRIRSCANWTQATQTIALQPDMSQ